MLPIQLDGNTKLYGIIGNPIQHSFSPKMQTTAFQKTNINAVYLPFLIEHHQLPKLLNAFLICNVQGFNVTVPYKKSIIPYLSKVSNDAKLLESVNTVYRQGNTWFGTSTDGLGFIRSLKERNIELQGKSVLLIGAGGSASIISLALAKEKIQSLTIVNRTQEKAEKIQNMLLKIVQGIEIKTQKPSINETFDLLINTTSVGMDGKSLPIEEPFISSSKQIIDIIYNPHETPLLKIAKSLNIPWMNGLEMLLYQGAESFEIWTQKKAPMHEMRQCLI